MEDQISGTNEAQGNPTEVDPWIAAFAALEPKSEEASETDTGTDGDQSAEDTQSTSEQQELSDKDAPEDSNASEDDAGGLGSDAGKSDDENRNAFASHHEVTEESIKQYEQELNDNIREQAINDVAQEFIKRGIRNNNGVLGATLDDSDICKRDEDGVPRFYNPETGREFTGDNPRRQAQEWVDDYNKELARVFNNTCQQYEKHLIDESAPQLAVMKFAPKYEKLDDIRKGMFDNVIEDYEITNDSGQVVGYSCDLDKALALVERQITMIQNYAKANTPQQTQQPTGPALDMKTSSGAVQAGEQKPINSLADAMEQLQNEQLAKLNK